MMRYQQQFAFFDASKVPAAIRLVNLARGRRDDLDALLARIMADIAERQPAFVAIDSFRTSRGHPAAGHDRAPLALADFVQRLALQLTSWEVTSFLIGEYSEDEARHPVFTVADSILWLSEDVDRNSAVRKLRATKVRGRSPMPGLAHVSHRERRDAGLPANPRSSSTTGCTIPERLRTGVPGLDEMMCGGIPEGDVADAHRTCRAAARRRSPRSSSRRDSARAITVSSPCSRNFPKPFWHAPSRPSGFRRDDRARAGLRCSISGR